MDATMTPSRVNQVEAMMRPRAMYEHHGSAYRMLALDEVVRSLGAEGGDADLLETAEALLAEARTRYRQRFPGLGEEVF